MVGLKIEITRFVEEGQPNVVECRFFDAHSKEHLIIEKVSVISAQDLSATDVYPRDEVISCTVLQKRNQGESGIIEIDTSKPWGIESIEGKTVFEVRPDQLVQMEERGD